VIGRRELVGSSCKQSIGDGDGKAATGGIEM
jgi:hypothetical protein